jgi:hypothetical protein
MATLTGHVSHYTEEMAAERAARCVKGMHAIAEGIEVRYVSAYLLAASRCNRPGSQLNVRVQADFRFVPIQLAERRPLAEQLGNSVHVTVSTICRISFVCTQARIETE